MWSMGDAESADEVLELLRARVTHHGLRLVIDGVASASRLFENQLTEAVELSEGVLADPEASAHAVEWAVFGGALALALMGRGDDVAVVAERGHAIETKVDGLLRYLTAFGEVRALVLAGDFDTAAQRSADIIRVTASGQYLAWGMANELVGTVELARGHFADTVLDDGTDRRRPDVGVGGVVELPGEAAAGAIVLRAWARGAGRQDGRRAADAFRPPRRGVRAAAARSPSRGWPRRREMSAPQSNWPWMPRGWRRSPDSGRSKCWRCTTRCGSATSRALERLIDLPVGTGGRLASVIAAHATAVRDRDAAGIYAASEQFEQLDALLSAADAAAQAAVAFEAADDRRRSVEAAATANRLAAQCGGIRTPALDLAAHPLPLTVREREIANLVAAGLTNRDIADRLAVSVRTVEGHLYRACIKLDISDREELAAMIRSGTGG